MTTQDDALSAHFDRVDLTDDACMRHWEQAFGVTVDPLRASVEAAGDRPEAVHEHLLNQGGSAGPS